MGEGLLLAGLLTFSQQYNVTNDDQYNNAIKHASLAAFQQSGLKRISDKEVKSYERWYKEKTPDELEMFLGYSVWVYKVVQDGKIVYSWSF